MPSLSAPAAPRAALGTPEMRLLLCCARLEPTRADDERLRAVLGARDVDWERFTALALRHKMLPLAWWHLRGQRDLIPEAAARRLGAAFLANADRMLRLSAELLMLSARLAAEGIAMVPYKGPALAARLYGNLALRQAGDLDVLVRRRDVGRARALLLERGYRPRHVLSEGGAAFMRASRYSEELDREGGPSVELHWAFTNGDVALALGLDELAPRLARTRLGGGEVPMLGNEDLLLVLCVHGCKHRWDRLEWLVGVAELVRADGAALDWAGVVAQAERLGVRRMLLLGLLLSHEVLGAPVPERIILQARADDAVARLAGHVPALLVADPADGESADSLPTDLFRLQLRERPRDWLRFVWYRLTTPSQPQRWSAVPLGGSWVPLHGILRPFRLAAKLPAALRRYATAARARRAAADRRA